MIIKPIKHHMYFRHRLSMPQETFNSNVIGSTCHPPSPRTVRLSAFQGGHLSSASGFLIGLETKFLPLHELYFESEVSLLALICSSLDGIIYSMDQTLGDSEGQGSLACCSLQGHNRI